MLPSMPSAIVGTVIFVCAIFLGLAYLTKWRLQLKDLFTGGHEADDFMPGSASARRRRAAAQIEITPRDHVLVANGWHPDDVMAARRNGIELSDNPPY
jgi:hypothetical protein